MLVIGLWAFNKEKAPSRILWILMYINVKTVKTSRKPRSRGTSPSSSSSTRRARGMPSTCCREPSCSGNPSDCRTRRLVWGWGLQASDLRDLLRISRSWTEAEGQECGLAKVGRGQSQLRWVESSLATISSFAFLQDIISSLRLLSGVAATTTPLSHFQYSIQNSKHSPKLASNKMQFMKGKSSTSEIANVTLKMTRKSCW